jgi:hypothetical protein
LPVKAERLEKKLTAAVAPRPMAKPAAGGCWQETAPTKRTAAAAVLAAPAEVRDRAAAAMQRDLLPADVLRAARTVRHHCASSDPGADVVAPACRVSVE